MNSYVQQLHIYLRGGQTLTVPFNAESPDKLNSQIDAFVAALGDPEKSQKNFVFQGQRLVLVHLSEVAALDVVSLVRKEAEGEAKE